MKGPIFPGVQVLWLAINVALLCSLFLGVGAFAAPSKDFTEVKASYLKLRNIDNGVEKLQSWKDLASDLESFVSSKGSGHASSALFHVSIVYEKLFEATREKEFLEKSLTAVKNLVVQFPKDSLADDALIRHAEILSRYHPDRAKERELLERVLKEYPQGDLVDKAKHLLAHEEELSPESRQDFNQKNGDGKVVIVLDPGHGGEDRGAPGVFNLLEKDVVLSVALLLEKRLEKELSVRVELTRRGDSFVPLEQRTAFANQLEADLFVSLHANSSPKSRLQGLEVYYLDMAGDAASKRLAEIENGSDPANDVMGDLSFMMSDLIQNSKIDRSAELAKVLSNGLYDFLHPRWPHVKRLGVKKAPFFVLVGAEMPCALVELFFIDHKIDGDFLLREDFRSDMSEGLFRAIKTFVTDTDGTK